MLGATWIEEIEETPIPTIPDVTITSVSKNRISDKVGMDRAIVSFLFNTDVVEWTVRVMGTSPHTGIHADSYVGHVASGVLQDAEIDWTKCYQEGENRVNIYGKNENGEWTLYQGSIPEIKTMPVFLNPTQIVIVNT